MAKLLEGLDRRSDLDETFRNLSINLQNKFPEIKIDIPGMEADLPSPGAINFLLFLCSLLFGMIWITYITFFNSRIVGKIVTRIANKFVKDGYVRVRFSLLFQQLGSLSGNDQLFIGRDHQHLDRAIQAGNVSIRSLTMTIVSFVISLNSKWLKQVHHFLSLES